LGIDLGEFLQLLLKRAEMLHARTGRLLLGRGFEEELIHFAHGQALGQIIERAMLGATVMTMALGFATSGKALHDRSAEEVSGNVQLLQEKASALAESQGGLARVIENPRHVYGEDKESAARVNEKESAPETRQCSTPSKY
jgi:hypothetical protein